MSDKPLDFDRLSKLVALFAADTGEAANAFQKARELVSASPQSWTDVAQLLVSRGARQHDRQAGGADAEELREAQRQLALAQDQVRRLRREKAEQSRLSEQVLRPLEQENAQLKAALANAKAANELRPLAQEMEVITVKGELDRLRDELDRLRDELDRLRGAELTAAKARPRRGDVPELLRRAHADPALAALSVRQLAQRLGVSPQTVFSHRKHNGVADVG
jgi:hypothetical protein